MNVGVNILLINLGFRGPCAQVPAAAALIVTLMLDSDLSEVTKDVLHLGVGSASAFAAKVIEPCNFVHEVVDDGNDDLWQSFSQQLILKFGIFGKSLQ